MRSSSGCCPRLGKPLGFQPVFACVSKSLEESLTRISKLTDKVTDKGQVRVIAGTCHRGQATSLRTESLPD